ncbi:MAG TPA: porin family protein [Bryobacteraceae bacterium]|jgi:hypothetical protein|nr:porin family protein [Bryobacteraceae bacterium]
MRSLFLIASVMCCQVAFAQHLFSFGVKGGFPLTDPLSDGTFNSVDVVTHVFSASKNYVVGPMVELNLPFGLAVEADALYRPLNLTTETQLVSSPSLVNRLSVDASSMEFPILLKAHFLHTPIVKPYVEAGPIFRYVASKVQYLSNSGFALGAGVDVKLLLVRIAPELRYSHWGSDSASPLLNVSLPPSNKNQVEFLIGLSF